MEAPEGQRRRRRRSEVFEAKQMKRKVKRNFKLLSLLLLFSTTSFVILPQLEAQQIEQRTNSTEIHKAQVTQQLKKRQVDHHEEPLALVSAQNESENNNGNGKGQGKRTAYACEEKTLEIECSAGESIQLVRANYGRFSIQICNDHGQLDWKVNCVSPDSKDITARSCQAKQSCQLLASNDIFGDSCPGTQKYLEVHYQCVPASTLAVSPLINRTLNDQQQVTTKATNQIRLPTIIKTTNSVGNNVIQQQQHENINSGINSETTPHLPRQWTPTPPTQREQQQLPNWIMEVPGGFPGISATSGTTTMVTPTSSSEHAAHSAACPEIVWRQIRWPQTEANALAQMPCGPQASGQASLVCQSSGQWANRVHALHCQSHWMHNLTTRLEAGDSPLSALDELVKRTSSGPNAPALYGSDLIQVARIAARLVADMESLLSGIGDDKQRISFAREMIQLLVELIDNLANEQQLDAWHDLATGSGERQRVAGQLVSSLESGCVTLAATLQQLSGLPEDQQLQQSFHKITEFVYVNMPLISSLLGTKWMNLEQKFALNLQASASDFDTANLKVVFVMVRNLGVQAMEPMVRQANGEQTANKLIVNSDLVSFSIVADSRSRSLKVDFSAPIELIFKHHYTLTSDNYNKQPTSCVYWNASSSDWHSDGCKLMASNSTHSICACNHLTTFALVTDFLDSSLAHTNASPHTQTQTPNVGQDQQLLAIRPTTRFHLDAQVALDSSSYATSGELLLANGQRAIHLAKLLDGNLFAPGSEPTSARLLLHGSLLLTGLMLATLLAAAAHNRAHARRLLAVMPSQPPPSLLVHHHHHNHHQHAYGPSLQPTAFAPPTTTHQGVVQTTSGLDLVASSQQTPSTQQASYSSELSSSQSSQRLVGLKPPVAVYDEFVQKPCTTTTKQVALVPFHLILKLFALQLVLILLIESQTFLAASSQLARRHYLSFTQPQITQQLDPIGLITWSALLIFYYLASTLLCWLLAQLIQLNAHLLLASRQSYLADRKRRLSHKPQATSSSYAPIQMISGNGTSTMVYGAAGGATNQTATNRYACQIVQQQQSSSSPTLSTFSSSLNEPLDTQQRMYATNGTRQQQQSYNTKQRLDSLSYASTKQQSYNYESTTTICHALLKLSSSKQLNWLLIHFGPLLLACLLIWLSYGGSASAINAHAYTASTSTQLAYWPLALDSSWTLSAVVHLYCLPSICLALGVLALVLLKRAGSSQQKVPYGQQQQQAQTGELNECVGGGANKNWQLDGHYESVAALELALESKRSRFDCLTLVALLALNSICWLSFSLHCHQALSGGSSSLQQTSNLLATFAVSNLLIALLICASQRQTLRRALQLAGWSRLFSSSNNNTPGSYAINAGAKSAPSPASTSDSRQSQMSHGGGAGVDAPPPSGFYEAGALPVGGHYQAGNSGKGPFVIARSRPSYGPQQLYGQAYQQQQQQFVAQQQQQQHLYQQLALSQQHIYDSTSNLNNNNVSDQQQQQQHLNALHLMQQQQQQQANAYTRAMQFGGSQFHLNHAPQATTTTGGNMTLRPQQQQQMFTSSTQAARTQHDLLGMCPISGNQHGKTLSASSALGHSAANNQQPRPIQGEADGPLVALAATTTTTTNSSRLHHHEQCATFGPQSQQQQQVNNTFEHQQSSSSSSNGGHLQQWTTSAVKQSTNNNNNNYTEALKAALEQQQHFRRANSSRDSMIDRHARQSSPARARHTRGLDSNIYDVANCVP